MKIRTTAMGVIPGLLALALLAAPSVQAQTHPVPSRVTAEVDDTNTVKLKGNIHPLARPEFDQGAVADSQPMTRMLLTLQRSAAQETALQQLMDAQQTKGSASYHAWLTPTQFGQQFGPSDADVQAVTDWLTRQGFQVAKVAAGRTAIEFNGTAGQVRSAFHTEIHKFSVNGEVHFANVSDPAIPGALSPVLNGVVALHNFPKSSYARNSGVYRRVKGSQQIQPLFTFGNPARFALGPGDWAKIYSVPTTAVCGGQTCTGAGQSIAVIAQTNINLQDVTAFRHMFGLDQNSPANNVTVVVNGVDPGILGPDTTNDELESDLDAQWAGAIAPNANILLVVSQGTLSNPTQVSQGVDLSALYAVDNNLAPIISDSYGNCEGFLLTAGNQFYNVLWQQAAAQGITVAVAAGDNGPAGCDPFADPNAATLGVAVSGIASTPFNVAVGGTDFDPTTTGNSKYWNTTTDTINSALGYIPETTWDDSACAMAFPVACTSVDTVFAADLAAGSGGPSNCVVANPSNNAAGFACTTNSTYPKGGYVKPSFQSALTPADLVRDIPDISFFGSDGGPLQGGSGIALVVCQSDSNPQGSTTPTGTACNLSTPFADFSLVGGTSAATPTFAAVMALVNQATGQRQGNANYVLYNLAGNDTNYMGGSCLTKLPASPNSLCIFNDVNSGNNSVACDAGTPNCSNSGSGAGAFGVIVCATTTQACPAADAQSPAFQSAPKYDLATGLGSINVGNLLSNWTSATRAATTTTVATVTGGSVAGTPFTASVSVSPSTAMGSVSLIALDGSTPAKVLGTIGSDSSGNPFTLTGGTATVTGNSLPVGSVSVEATYSGSATFAVSTSPALPLAGAVSGAGYTAKTTVSIVNSSQVTSTGNQNFPYGTPYSLAVVVTRSDGTSCSFGAPSTKPAIPCPTGKITLTDNGAALNDFLSNGAATNVTSLNNQGISEDQPINLPATVNGATPGVHKIVATYSGDANYAAGAPSNTLQITIQQVPTTTQVAASLSSVASGTSVQLSALISPNSSSNGNAPCGTGSTGTVQFTENGTALAGTVTYTPVNGQTNPNGASCTATLTTAISSLYPPGTREPRPTLPLWPMVFAVLSIVLFTLGWHWMPENRRRTYAYASFLALALVAVAIAGCGGGGSSNGGHTATIKAAFSGDANYAASSGTTTITVQ
ncbi:MAG TPA: protease pro-enzyme activation domain-containing protein [Candidatus Sulfotelmatobacter sp.]|nr:protease pro-enzyme activation domain-containing protein [Candidatus Sulfotelmatobacter sp.]